MKKPFLILRPSGIYHIIYYIDNTKKSISTGSSDKKFAKEILEKFKPPDKRIKLLDFINLYFLPNYENPRTREVYNSEINLFVKAKDNLYMDKYTSSMINSYVRSIRRSAYTLNRKRRVLSTIFNQALKLKFINSNPVSDVPNIRLPESEFSYFTKSQFNNLIAAIRDYSSNGITNRYNTNLWKSYYIDLFTFAAYSGLRFSEIKHLKSQDVLIEKRLIKVLSSEKEHRTKSSKTRFVEMHPKIIDIYNRRKDNEYLFMSFENKLISADRITKQLKKFNVAAGNPPILNFKSFRSTFGMWLINNGASVEFVSEQLGHADIRTTIRHYAKYITKKYTGKIELI